MANFSTLNSENVDYTLNTADYGYYEWVEPYLRIIFRLPADQFHETILRAMATKFNSKTEEYNVNFKFLDLKTDQKPAKPSEPKPKKQRELKYENLKVFGNYQNAFYFAFFVNTTFVVMSFCVEKKQRSYEFLKLMGATNGEILFGHFINHFLVWLFPFAVCMFYFWNFVPKESLPTNIPVSLLYFSLLFFVHSIAFLFLLSSPFDSYLYPELLYVLSSFGCFSLTIVEPKGFLGILLLVHPLAALQKLTKVFEQLSFESSFDENIFKLFFHSGETHISLFLLAFIIICFIVIELALTNYVIQVNPFQKGIAKPFYYFLMSDYWMSRDHITTYTPPDRKEFEKVPADRKPAIILKDIYKSFRSWFIFGKFQVLKDFDFAIYEKQITVLLGHNVSPP